MASHHARLRELFEAACDLPQAQQLALLDEHCSDDPELRQELQQLLQSDANNSGIFADNETTDGINFQFDTTVEEPEVPQHIGHYRIQKVLGQGGMGVVYLARQQNPDRDVAVKVIRSGMVSASLLKRFELEATVLGRLKHPGIASIYEANVFVDSVSKQERPYLAMEFVQGEPLSRFIQQTNPDKRERLRLIVQICEAVNHAHQRGVIHRDLKPGNILVKQDGQPCILDFGIARATRQEPGMPTLQTRVGQLIGTLPYMSPEQVAGSSLDVDPRSDVYALGVLAYEMLSGKLPYHIDEKEYLNAARAITQQAPTSLASLGREYQGDLNTVILKALEKDPDRRYQTASDFADDVQRFLDDQPIHARRSGRLERSWRWCRRNRTVAALLASVAALVLSVAVISTVSTIRLGKAAVRIEEESLNANRRLFDSYVDQAKLHRTTRRPGQRLDSLAALENASQLLPELNFQGDEFDARLMQLRNDTIDSLALFDLQETHFWEQPDGFDKAQFDASGEYYAVSFDDGTIQVREVKDNRLVHEWPGFGNKVWVLRFSPQSSYFAAVIPAIKQRLLQVWDMKTGKVVIKERVQVQSDCYAFSLDDRKFANYNVAEGNIQLFDLERPGDLPVLFKPEYPPGNLYFRPDGFELTYRRLKGPSMEGQLEVWDLEDQTSRLIEGDSFVYSIDWSSSGETMATGLEDGVIRLRDVENQDKSTGLLVGHTGPVVYVSYDPSGEFLLSYAWDGTQRIWDVKRKKELFRSDSGIIADAEFHTARKQLGFYREGGYGIREFGFDNAVTWLPARSGVRDFQFHPTAPLIASTTHDGFLIWDAETNTVVAEQDNGFFTFSLLFSPDGSRLYSSGRAGIQEWPLEFDASGHQVSIGSPVQLLKAEELGKRTGLEFSEKRSIENLSLDQTGRWLAIDCGDFVAAIMDLQNPGSQLLPLATGHSFINHAMISPDGKWVVTTTWKGGGVKVYDARNGGFVTNLIEESGTAVPVFSPDGTSLAIAVAIKNANAVKTELMIWDVGTWTIQRTYLREKPKWLGTLAWSPDGQYLVSAYDRHSLQLRDAETGKRLAIFRVRGGDEIGKVRFSPDGKTLAAISRGSIVKWNLPAIRKRLDPMGIDWE